MTAYCTLDQAKQYMAAELSTDDTVLLGLIRQVSNRIDRMFLPKRRAPVFAPYIETRNQYRLASNKIDSYLGTFYLGEPILSLSAVTAGATALTVGSAVQLYQGDISPYMNLQLLDRCCGGWYQYLTCDNCAAPAFVSVAGTWGYHTDYANAWIDSLQDVPAGNITAAATSFIVSDVDAADSLGLTPAISAGNLLQVDSEWMEVTATNTTTNAVTVRRGVNGSTAAAHTAGTAIETFQVEEAVNRATYRQAALQYAKIGAYDNVTVTDLTNVGFTADVLAEFSTLLNLFANM